MIRACDKVRQSLWVVETEEFQKHVQINSENILDDVKTNIETYGK